MYTWAKFPFAKRDFFNFEEAKAKLCCACVRVNCLLICLVHIDKLYCLYVQVLQNQLKQFYVLNFRNKERDTSGTGEKEKAKAVVPPIKFLALVLTLVQNSPYRATVLIWSLLLWQMLWPKAMWGGKNLLGLYFLVSTHHWERKRQEVRERKRQEVKEEQREDPCRNTYCLLACSLRLIPASFLTQPRTTCSGVTPPKVGWAFLHQLTIKKIPPQMKLQANLTEAIAALSWDSKLCQVEALSVVYICTLNNPRGCDSHRVLIVN